MEPSVGFFEEVDYFFMENLFVGDYGCNFALAS
jgi:hypothetical protein